VILEKVKLKQQPNSKTEPISRNSLCRVEIAFARTKPCDITLVTNIGCKLLIDSKIVLWERWLRYDFVTLVHLPGLVSWSHAAIRGFRRAANRQRNRRNVPVNKNSRGDVWLFRPLGLLI
jgi:hypothetical protein